VVNGPNIFQMLLVCFLCHNACRACATSMTSVRPSVYNVGGAHAKKWKSPYDRIGRCLGYLHAKADPDRYPVIPNCTEEERRDMEKMCSFTSLLGQ